MIESVQFPCPHCGAPATVTQVQGDRCGGCGGEFKWFAAGERQAAMDYLEILSGRKHLLALPVGEGFIIAHE